jgi:hypothetical protein
MFESDSPPAAGQPADSATLVPAGVASFRPFISPDLPPPPPDIQFTAFGPTPIRRPEPACE